MKQLNIAEGQSVAAGQLVAVLDATTLGYLVSASSATVGQAQDAVGQAHVGLAQAEKSAAQASDAYKRMKLLHDTRLYAPSSGYISKKFTEVGQNIAPAQPVAMLVDIRQVKVKISVPEDEIARVRLGQTLRFKVSSLPGKSFTARVTEKGVAADPITRSYEVKALADNADRKLLRGMVCDVYAQQASPTAAFTLPANIIQIDVDNRPFVWTVVGGVARKTSVMLGESVGDNVQIVGGLSSKDRIIVEGQQKVSNGMRVE